MNNYENVTTILYLPALIYEQQEYTYPWYTVRFFLERCYIFDGHQRYFLNRCENQLNMTEKSWLPSSLVSLNTNIPSLVKQNMKIKKEIWFTFFQTETFFHGWVWLLSGNTYISFISISAISTDVLNMDTILLTVVIHYMVSYLLLGCTHCKNNKFSTFKCLLSII